MIDKSVVRHVAMLSRLRLSDEDLELYSRQLTDIIHYVDKLNELDIQGVSPTSHVSSDLKNIDRPDSIKPSLPVDDVLSNAPDREGDYFRIPRVIDNR